MSLASTAFPVPASAFPGPAALAQAARAAIDWIRRRHADRVQRRVLHSLSEHILRDIGIGPSEIDAIVSARRSRVPRPNGLFLL